MEWNDHEENATAKWETALESLDETSYLAYYATAHENLTANSGSEECPSVFLKSSKNCGKNEEKNVGLKIPEVHFPSDLNSQQNMEPTKKTPSNKYDYVPSVVGDYIRSKSPSAEFFRRKAPLKEIQCTVPKNKLTSNPSLSAKDFRNVVSPVGVYIKGGNKVLKKSSTSKTKVDESEKENVGRSFFNNAFLE